LNVVVELDSPTDPVIVISRVFDAPLERVWAAFTQQDQVSLWFGGHGFSSPLCEMDVRPRGLWRHMLQTPDGSRFGFDSVFREVERPNRLTWATGEGSREAINVNVFEATPSGVKWTLTARFMSIAERDQSAAMGFPVMVTQGAERLAAHLQAK
jgi:uncharacterized protein YndB with AHSA1/START domain